MTANDATPFPAMPKVKGFKIGHHTHVRCDFSMHEYNLASMAMNAHDDLVAALSDAIPYMQDLVAIEKAGLPNGFKKGVVAGHLKNAEKALAKAKVQS